MTLFNDIASISHFRLLQIVFYCRIYYFFCRFSPKKICSAFDIKYKTFDTIKYDVCPAIIRTIRAKFLPYGNQTASDD